MPPAPSGAPSRTSPERDDDGRGLCAGSDEGDDEEEDEEGDERVAGAVALAGGGVAVVVQVGLEDDEAQLAARPRARPGDHLPALHAAALAVVAHLGAQAEPWAPAWHPGPPTAEPDVALSDLI